MRIQSNIPTVMAGQVTSGGNGNAVFTTQVHAWSKGNSEFGGTRSLSVIHDIWSGLGAQAMGAAMRREEAALELILSGVSGGAL